MKTDDVVTSLAQAIDSVLAQQLIDEAVSIEETFSLRKWKYTELDGGRFAEVAARIVYASDSQNLSLKKGVDDCLKYVDNNQVSHSYPEPQGAIHLAKVIRAIYKLRSQRGAVHVSPTYTANELDSRFILESVRWVLAEILRVFGSFKPDDLAELVRSLSRFPQPLMRIYGETALLQSTTFTNEEEVLAHLLFADGGLQSRDLCAVIPKAPSGVRTAIAKLASGEVREIVKRGDKYLITDLGIARVEQKIAQER
ncbi:hypothetical protein [uncultured Jatrophihabitans sp.]|uniref:hypothetical protein n=1 Tax=uncultured Jatrophihabitans sp. TaxID=1610747 RepID=UPI0035CB4634